jgi:hypothetical protein
MDKCRVGRSVLTAVSAVHSAPKGSVNTALVVPMRAVSAGTCRVGRFQMSAHKCRVGRSGWAGVSRLSNLILN